MADFFPPQTPLDPLATPASWQSRMGTMSPMILDNNNNSNNNNPSYQPNNGLGEEIQSFFDEATETPDLTLQQGTGIPLEAQDHSALAVPGSPYQLDCEPQPKSGVLEELIAPNQHQHQQHNKKGLPAAMPIPASKTQSKSKKRGRKPKKKSQESTTALPSSTMTNTNTTPYDCDPDGLPKDPRRRRILERNRIAATKCRLRKRDEASALASREQAMEDQNRYLSNCFDSLTAEIYNLKTQLLRHTDCDCVLIQRYIANEAKRSVETMTMAAAAGYVDPSSSFSSGSYQGSSSVSSADSFSVQSPPPVAGAEGFQTQWASEAYPALPGPEDGVVFGYEGYDEMQMPVDNPANCQPLDGLPSATSIDCGGSMYMDIEPHPVEDVVWNPQFEFQACLDINS